MIPKNRIPTHPGEILIKDFLQPMNIISIVNIHIFIHLRNNLDLIIITFTTQDRRQVGLKPEAVESRPTVLQIFRTKIRSHMRRDLY